MLVGLDALNLPPALRLRCLCLAYMSWPIFVGFSSESSTFRYFTLLFWSASVHGTANILPITAGGKDGEKLSPVMATWCILVEGGSLWFSWRKKPPWQEACYGRTSLVFWKWRLVP